MIYKSVYQSQTEDGESMTADTLREDDPTTNTSLVDQCGNPIYRIPGKFKFRFVRE